MTFSLWISFINISRCGPRQIVIIQALSTPRTRKYKFLIRLINARYVNGNENEIVEDNQDLIKKNDFSLGCFLFIDSFHLASFKSDDYLWFYNYEE